MHYLKETSDVAVYGDRTNQTTNELASERERKKIERNLYGECEVESVWVRFWIVCSVGIIHEAMVDESRMSMALVLLKHDCTAYL